MMKSLRIASLALVSISAIAVSPAAQAVTVEPGQQAIVIEGGLDHLVASLREEVAKGETKCDAMLAKLDEALKLIDAKLEQGVPNEADYLKAREEISQLRYSLECVATKMTQVVRGFGGGPNGVSGRFPAPRFSSSPFFRGGGGAGGGGGGFGIGPGPFLIGGGIAVAIAASDDDDPGVVASISSSN